MIREPILFRPFFSLLLLLSFSPFCTYEPTSQIHPRGLALAGPFFCCQVRGLVRRLRTLFREALTSHLPSLSPFRYKNAGRQSQPCPDCFYLPVFHMLPYRAAFCFILLSDPQCPENLCLPGRAKRKLSPQPPLPGPEPPRKPGG